MKSHDLMNINPKAYKPSDAPSRSMSWFIDIIPIIYIFYTHNFYTQIAAFKLYAACKTFQQIFMCCIPA